MNIYEIHSSELCNLYTNKYQGRTEEYMARMTFIGQIHRRYMPVSDAYSIRS